MAPHALTDLNDTSGYYPSTVDRIWPQTPACQKSSKAPLIKPALKAEIPFGNLAFGSEPPKNTWNLTSDEISEVEKNVRYFLSMRKDLTWRTVSELLTRLEPTAQRHQSNNIPPRERVKIKIENHSGSCLRRTAILHSFWAGSVPIFRLPECDHTCRALELCRQQTRHGRSDRREKRCHSSVNLARRWH